MDPRKLQSYDLFFSARKRVLSGSGLCVLGSLVVLFCLVSIAAPPTFSSPLFSWFSSVSDYALPPSDPQTFEVSILEGDPPTASNSVTKSDLLKTHLGVLEEGDKNSRNPMNVEKTHDGDPPTASIPVTKPDLLKTRVGDLAEGNKDSRNPVNVVKPHDGNPPTASISVTKSDLLQAHTGDLAEGDKDSRNPKNVNKTLNGVFSENSSGGRDPGLTKSLEGNWSLNSTDPPTSSFNGGEADESKHQLKRNWTLENSDPPTSSFNGGEPDESKKHRLNTSTGDSHNSGIFVNSTTSEGNPHGKDASVSSSHNIKENPNIVKSNEKKETDGKGNNESTSNSSNSTTTAKGSSKKKKCDIFDGQWVRDERGPLYPAGSCPFIDNDFNCYKNGRPDDGFSKWRWQPKDCDIPRLNATDFLERLRGKRIIFVGDSLNRNMWESMVCILRNNIRDKSRVYELSGRSNFKTSGYYAFRFEDYNCSVDFVRSTFLVKEIYHKNKNGSEDEKLRLDLIDETTTAYREAKVIVFNTGHWWTHEKTSKGIEYYQEGNYVYPVLKPMEAYKKALETWGKWVDNNIDSNRSRVIFRGYSPSHFRGGQWNSGGQCHKESEPIFNERYLTKYPSKARALEQVMKQMRTPVTYLNISRLTDFRKDGHPSIYRKTYKSVEEQIAAEKSQDCSHWCLPGIPDTWNELLYASLTMDGQHSL